MKEKYNDEYDNMILEEYLPDIKVDCDCCCEKSQEIKFQPCEDIKDVNLPCKYDSPIAIGCQGRLLKIKVKLSNVCFGRFINVGVLLSEKIGRESVIQGFRACKIKVPDKPKCVKENCIDICTDEFCFVLPEQKSREYKDDPCSICEKLDEKHDEKHETCDGICKKRIVKVKVIAHYSSFQPSHDCVCNKKDSR